MASGKLLIVDDNALVRQMIASLARELACPSLRQLQSTLHRHRLPTAISICCFVMMTWAMVGQVWNS